MRSTKATARKGAMTASSCTATPWLLEQPGQLGAVLREPRHLGCRLATRVRRRVPSLTAFGTAA